MPNFSKLNSDLLNSIYKEILEEDLEINPNSEFRSFASSLDNSAQEMEMTNSSTNYLNNLNNSNLSQISLNETEREITPRRRAIVVDWLIEIHNHFELGDECLFLSIKIFVFIK